MMRPFLSGLCFLLIVACVASCNRSTKQVQKGETSTGAGSSQTQKDADVLSKYSLSELQQVITNRSNKALYANEPSDIKNIPTAEVADNIIFRQKTLYGSDRRKDYFEIQDPEVLKAADSVASIIPLKYLKLQTNSTTPAITVFLASESLALPHVYMAKSMADYHAKHPNILKLARPLTPGSWEAKLKATAAYLRGETATLRLGDIVKAESEYAFFHV